MAGMTLPNHLVFKGNNPPAWSPTVPGTPSFSALKVAKKPLDLKDSVGGTSHFFYVADGFLNREECVELIRQFDQTTPEPVGVDGYVTPKDKDSIGSYRTNGWTVDLAQKLTPGFLKVLQDEKTFEPVTGQADVFRSNTGGDIAIPTPQRKLTLAGTTPYMRFMRYFSGGKHVPHYDQLYLDNAGQYVTLMSWVIYLNTPRGTGGDFQFVEDGQGPTIPSQRNRSDWTRMAVDDEVIASVSPKEGRLLVFPHWLPHQVQLYQSDTMEADGRRIIARGDVVYSWA
jgi:hypothetical protein